MQHLATAQHRYDRMEPTPQVARLLRLPESEPLVLMREDIARDYRAAQDISTAWYDELFDEDDNNVVVGRLLAGDDAGALAAIKCALRSVADARMLREE
ncbi:MAG: hypothetical protein JO002_02520 [Burkholderiaceae bacterium]|nr:hypothetical protein [Burkholderiaceae bacterium]